MSPGDERPARGERERLAREALLPLDPGERPRPLIVAIVVCARARAPL